jgi:protein-tyrosine phosphatase
MRILMVCLGNICRSPIAEGVLQHKADLKGLGWVVESAGTESYHIGEPPHRLSQKICIENGIDISHQRARKFTRADVGRYDLIYAMAEDVLREIQLSTSSVGSDTHIRLFLEELNPGMSESVPDPYYGGEDGYHHVFDLVNRTCDAIIDRYAYRAGN